MDALSHEPGVVHRLGRLLAQWAWEGARLAGIVTRNFGSVAWMAIACVAVAVVAAVQEQRARMQLDDARRQIAELSATASRPSERRVPAPSKLTAFEDILLSHADIPIAVQDLLELAETHHLSIARGDYRPQVDTSGGFMRYRMSLPVKGDAQAVHRYMLAALRAHRTLALESAQFKRERIESSEIEARIQWVILTRLPSADAAAAPAGASSQGRSP
jgi:hypothetical protein